MDKIIVIVGPTGVGKTKLSLELAQHFDGEIISADSMQVYRNMDIGTAKIKDQKGIKHHLLDIKDVTEDYNVFNYQQDCREAIHKIKANHKTPIIVGGTGLYVKAALYDYKFSNEKTNNQYNELTNEEIYTKIMNHDSSIIIDKCNRRRLVRTLNKIENNSLNRKYDPKLLYDVVFVGLDTSRETLYNLTDQRVDEMIDQLLVEVKLFYDNNIKTKALQTAIGYKELYEYFDHKISLTEAVELIKRNTRKYVKRQYTWFKNQMDIKWFDTNYQDFDKTVNDVIEYIKKI